MERPLSTVLRRLGAGIFLILVVVVASFLLVKLGAAPPDVLLGGPTPGVEERAQLIEDYGLDRPAFVQFVRYAIRVLGGEFGRSWLTGEHVLAELLLRVPATLELMLYAVVLGVLIAVPTGMAAAFARNTAEDRTVRGAAVLGEAMPPFFLALLLLLVFFRWLDVAPAPSGRISIVLSPPPTITGSYFIDAFLMQDSIAAQSALAQLVLPVLTLAMMVASSLTLLVRSAMLAQMEAPHFVYARAQGMSREMLTMMALRGALPAIGAGLAGQSATLLGMTALVEHVFSWGGVGQYGLDAMAKADFAGVQGFILVAAAFAALVHGLHALIRRLSRIRFIRT
jgi:peptide/nickel transport system permease protein